MSYKIVDFNKTITSQFPPEYQFPAEASVFDNDCLFYRIVGIDDKELSYALLGVLCGQIQFSREISENEYCQELKEIIERGYFDISYCGGVFTKRIIVSKDWKPAVMTFVNLCSEITQPIQPEGHNTRAFKKKWR